ncbi:ATP-binding protein [Sporosarcina sp. YIM B06819]|uniref:ATP-binding protein n=1 Tax=Sporosarcina sp. YIM B06819 TaxID=3081769 RepID=UPI00298C5692|nr:AAA family ATPase [Sporosarcina sp. YIM B06819]
MKIDKLIIYGFGKHDNVTVDFGTGITVLYGLNEAGKTTIQQFILHILFGFPPKNSALLRYEPKSGGKYGGQVHVVDKKYGKCMIERVRGKSAGDVTVHFEDGTTGGEQELSMLLRHYDRTSFESIFSFSLLQLQGFDKMDEEELSRTLLASGTTGVDSLIQLEKRMEKEMGELFKKSGKIPEINVKMLELRELELELKEAQGKVAEYAPAIQQLQEIDARLTKLYARQKTLQQDAQQLSIVRQLLPLHQKKIALEAKLTQLNASSFPVDGIRRYEALVDKWTEATATTQRLTEELTALAIKMPQQQPADRLTDSEVLLAKEAEWHGWCLAETAAADELRRLTSERSYLIGRLGVQGQLAEQRLLRADLSMQKEEEMHLLLGQLAESDQQIGYSERQLVQLDNDLLDIETKLATLQQADPSQEELERAQRWPQIRQQLAEAKAYMAFGGRQAEKSTIAVPAILLLLAVVCILIGFIQQHWFVVVIGAVIGVAGAFFWKQKDSQSNEPTKMREMERFIALYDGQEQQMEQLVERIASTKREKEGLQQAYASFERKHLALLAELDIFHDNRRQVESQLVQLLQAYGFDRLPSPAIIPELLRFIRQFQEVTRDIEEMNNQQQIAQKSIAIRVTEIEKVLQKSVPQEAMYEMLRREFIQLKEETEMLKSLTMSIQHKEQALKESAELADTLQDRLQQLLAEAGVETEEAFYVADRVHQEVGRLTEQLTDTQLQLSAHGAMEVPEGITEEDLVAKVTDNQTTKLVVDEQLKTLLNEQATLIHKTNHLLTDETYGRKLQLFEMKKGELAELAKRWSESKVIAEAIRRTMTDLKEKKLPEVLEVAEGLFRELTGGRYESLIVTESGRFEVLAIDGKRYPIGELSQATKEQAYIALRLALAASILGTAPFPMIMDDPFVHFDGQRLSRMIELLNQLQQHHQFIYFTCHKVMTEQWQDATILNVSDIGSEQGAITR